MNSIRLSEVVQRAAQTAGALRTRGAPLPRLGTRTVERDVEVRGLLGRPRTEKRSSTEAATAEGWDLGIRSPSRRKGGTLWVDCAILLPDGRLALARRDNGNPAESQLISRRATDTIRLAQHIADPQWLPVLPGDPGQEMMARYPRLRTALEGAAIVMQQLQTLCG